MRGASRGLADCASALLAMPSPIMASEARPRTKPRRPRSICGIAFGMTGSEDRLALDIFLRLLLDAQAHIGIELDVEVDGDGLLGRLHLHRRRAGRQGEAEDAKHN